MQGERLLRLDRRRLPGVLVELGQRYRLAAGFGTDGDDVAGEIADQVAAGNPRGQGESLAGGVGLCDAAADVIAMGGRFCRRQRVADGCGHREESVGGDGMNRIVCAAFAARGVRETECPR